MVWLKSPPEEELLNGITEVSKGSGTKLGMDSPVALGQLLLLPGVQPL